MADKQQTCWVLTRSINAYEQDGEYFVAVFTKKPTIQVLNDYIFEGDQASGHTVQARLKFLFHLEQGGGRQDIEHEWYHLKQEPLR